MSAIFAFCLGFLLNWPALLILLVLASWFEYADMHGMATFVAIITIAIATMYFHLTLMHFLALSGIYIAVGFVWSIWRYKRALDRAVEQVAKGAYHSKEELKDLHPVKAAGTIAVWVLIWPISLLESSLRDIFDGIQSLIKGVFKKIYAKLYGNALQKANVKDE